MSKINKKNSVFSSEELILIEETLNKVTYRGIPLGSTLAQYFFIEFKEGKGDWHWRKVLKDYLRYILFKFSPASIISKGNPENIQQISPAELNNKFLVSFETKRENYNKALLSLISSDKEGKLVGITFDQDIYNILNKLLSHSNLKPEIYLFPQQDYFNFDKWKKYSAQLIKDLNLVLDNLVKNNRLPFYAKYRIITEALQQSIRIESFYNLFSNIHPQGYITHWDRSDLSSCLIPILHKKSVKTYTLMHGVVNHKYGYFPPIANTILCWGQRQKEQLIDIGIKENIIEISGAPHIEELHLDHTIKQSFNEEINAKGNQKVIVLATNPLPDEQRKKITSIFCGAISELENTIGIIRSHPSEDEGFYKKLTFNYNNIYVDGFKKHNIKEILSIADIVLVYNSAFALESIINNIPVFIININDGFLGQAEDYIRIGKFPDAEDKQELAELIKRYFTEEQYRKEVKNNLISYKNKYCYLTGQASVQKIKELIIGL